MKRSEALRPLSRDHHRALSVALKLRRAEDAAQAGEMFLDFWRESGSNHFRIEEEVLLPEWGRLGSIDATAAARLAREHLEIRIEAGRIECGAELDLLHELGRKLADHVRFEERELFTAIEADLSEAQLAGLARLVVDAEGQS